MKHSSSLRVCSLLTKSIKGLLGYKPLYSFNQAVVNKNISKKFDELHIFDRGEIPKNLIKDRPYDQTTLKNGITVCSEYWPSDICTIAVFIKCGSRNETEETSGTAHFLEHLHFKGTKNRTRVDLEIEIENMGGQLNAYTSRENTSYTMTVFKNKIDKGVEILGDILCNSQYTNEAVESERDTIHRELQETQKEQMETTIEISHRGAFKNHQMALPILGKITNMYSIQRNMIVDYHKSNYFGDNIIIVAAGNHSHEQICKLIDQHFGVLPKESPTKLNKNNSNNQSKPQFHNEIYLLKSDITKDINIGLFYEAPSWRDPDYYSFLLLQRILGDKPDNQAEQQLIQYSQLNQFQVMLNQSCDQIKIQKGVYTPYRDVALFGNYFQGSIDCLPDAVRITNSIFQHYTQQLNDLEIERAKRRLYIELFQHETSNDISQAIGNHLLYFGRRVLRSEIAYRVASIEKKNLLNCIRKWFMAQNFSITVWGNIDKLASSLSKN